MRESVKKIAALGAILAVVSCTDACRANENSNRLAVGREAKTNKIVEVQLNFPVQFNYKSKSEILEMRSNELRKHPELIHGTYSPYEPIWQMEDGKPWWGTAGAAVFDSGERSMEGPAEESRFVMNPFMLVGANSGSTLIWRSHLFTERQLNDPAFPYFWLPESLQIDPPQSFALLRYNISGFQRKIVNSGLLKAPVNVMKFSLVAYNARDFGYNFIYFDEAKSINVINENPTREAVKINQYIHCGGTCGCASTCCNNMSPFTREIDRLQLQKLPARAVVCLWKESPKDVEQRPDMYFLLEFH